MKKTKATLVNWAKEFEEEINNLKALELEALYEKHYLLKEHRLKSLGSLLKKAETELEKRDFKEIPTDKLIDVYVKLSGIAQEQVTEPSFKSSGEIAEDKANRMLIDELTAPETYPQPEIKKLKAV
jgi:type II secretory pathway component PulK